MSNVQLPPDYLDDYIGQAPLGLAIAFLAIEPICVALRFYARRIGRVPWGTDDTLIIPASVLCIALCACVIAAVKCGGIGYHGAALALTAPGKLIVFGKFTIVVSLLYLAAVVFPKLAILAIYLRIFLQPRFRTACYVLATVLTANGIATTVVGLLICRPLEYLWDRTIPGGYCLSLNAWFRWSSLANIVTDVAMLVLPLPVIWELHTSRNVKIGLTITFATGSIGLVTSIIRFTNFFEHDEEVDPTWSAASLFAWTVCETGMYLIAACLPTYRPLARSLWKDGSLVSWIVSETKLFFASKTSRASKTSKSSHWRGENAAIDISLQGPQEPGFKRLQAERDNTFFFGKIENTISSAERGRLDGKTIGNGILVGHDVDVRGGQ